MILCCLASPTSEVARVPKFLCMTTKLILGRYMPYKESSQQIILGISVEHLIFLISHCIYRVKDKYTTIHPSDVVLLEGILVFYHKDVMDMFDMKLFVDTDADTRLARRGKYLMALSKYLDSNNLL